MIQNKLIASAIVSRETYEALVPVLQRKALGDIGRLVYEGITQYYGADPGADSVDRLLLQEQLVARYPQSEEDILKYFAEIGEGAKDQANIRSLARELNKRALGQELSIALAKNDDARVQKLIAALEKNEEDDASTTYDGAVKPSEFFGNTKGERIPLFPLRLNEKIDGGIFRQSQVCVLARPNVGKSTFCYNLAGGLAINGYRVLYMPNEDPHKVCVSRLLSRFVEEPFLDIHEDQDAAHTAALAKGFDRVVVHEINPGSLTEINAAVAKWKPDVFIVDQLYTIAMESKEGATREFASLSSGCRQVAKRHQCVSVVVTQVAEDAKTKLFLKQEDVEWSNTGVCAQMDLMIGLAQNEDLENQKKMMVSFPRWKFGEKPKPFTVAVDYQFNKVT